MKEQIVKRLNELNEIDPHLIYSMLDIKFHATEYDKLVDNPNIIVSSEPGVVKVLGLLNGLLRTDETYGPIVMVIGDDDKISFELYKEGN